MYIHTKLKLRSSNSQQILEVLLFSWWENRHMGTLLVNVGTLTQSFWEGILQYPGNHMHVSFSIDIQLLVIYSKSTKKHTLTGLYYWSLSTACVRQDALVYRTSKINIHFKRFIRVADMLAGG